VTFKQGLFLTALVLALLLLAGAGMTVRFAGSVYRRGRSALRLDGSAKGLSSAG
jgi:hypothetical protein